MYSLSEDIVAVIHLSIIYTNGVEYLKLETGRELVDYIDEIL